MKQLLKADVNVLMLQVYLFSLTTVFMPFFNAGINFLYIGITFLVLFYFLFFRGAELLRTSPPFLPVILFFYLVLSSVYNLGYLRISSLAYSGFFLFSYTLLIPLVTDLISVKAYKQLIKVIVQAFFVTMVLQQILQIIGLPVINLNPLFSEDFRSLLTFFRFNSLSSEPSYGSIIILVLAYSYWLASDRKFTERALFWAPVIYLWIMFASSLGYIVGLMLFLRMLPKKATFIILLSSVIILPAVIATIDFVPVMRITGLLKNIFTGLSPMELLKADLSAALRFVPTILLISDFSFTNPHYLFGYGMSYSSRFFGDLFMFEEEFLGGVIPQFIYDFGLVGFILLVSIIKRESLTRFFSFEFVVFIFVLTNANLNTQMVWIMIVFFAYNKKVLITKRSDEKNKDFAVLAV